jgi:molybdopterin molybdotransferase
MGSTPTNVLDFEQAIALILKHVSTQVVPTTERLPLLACVGRVLAQPILADRDQPPFDRATRDGFAVRAGDWTTGAALAVVGQLRAGEAWRGRPVAAGTAVEIMTGAPMPQGADAVVMVEHTMRREKSVSPSDARTLAPGENVVPRGAEARAGAQVIAAATRVSAAEIALAATCGYAELPVFAQPKVAIVATGDELVELADVPEAHQIRNSNSYAIAAMVAAAGGIPVRLTRACDLREEVRARIADARQADLIVLSGGVSMGEYDLVEEVLAGFDAEFLFTGVRLQPGRPAVFGRLPATAEHRECFFFGLPGNPISTQVTFHCFAEPFLRVLSGETGVAPKWAQATLAEAVSAQPNITRLLPARMEGVAVRLIPWQGSGDLAANARANCYAEFLPDRAYSSGDVLRVLLR